MSDIPDQPPLVSAVKARNVARLYKGLADALRADGINAEANAADRQSNWWMAYSISLSQIPPGRTDEGFGAP